MAKKRREKSEEDEVDFKIPKFDEEKFLKKERRNIKTLIISFGLWVLNIDSTYRWPLILLFGILGGAPFIRYLFSRLNIDLTDFGRKGWFTTYAIYFFTWIIVLIILVNPPFYDGEKPHVEIAVLPGMQEAGGTVQIVARILDNVRIEKEGITFTLTYPSGTSERITDFSYENNIFSYTYENTAQIMGEYRFQLIARDVNGLVNDATNDSFTYSNNTLQITSSRFTDIRSGDSIIISADEQISPEDFRVYYHIDNGSEINVNRDNRENKEKYETTAEYEGWKANSNVTLEVCAEVRHYFENLLVLFNNTVKDSTVYNFSTGDDSNIGTEEPLVEFNYTLAAQGKKQLPNTLNYRLPYPTMVQVPGFEVIVFIISLGIAVLILRNRKKNKKT